MVSMLQYINRTMHVHGLNVMNTAIQNPLSDGRQTIVNLWPRAGLMNYLTWILFSGITIVPRVMTIQNGTPQ